MSINYSKLTPGQIADYINQHFDTDDARASVILGQLDQRKTNAQNYNLDGIAHHVATKAREFNPTPEHLMSPADRQRYNQHCHNLLNETIPTFFDPTN